MPFCSPPNRRVVVGVVNLKTRTGPHFTLLFGSKHIHADVNTIYTLYFDEAKSIAWMRISVSTLILSLTLMSFVKIFMVWLLPENLLGPAIMVMTVGFFVSAGACETVITNSFGRSALGVCS